MVSGVIQSRSRSLWVWRLGGWKAGDNVSAWGKGWRGGERRGLESVAVVAVVVVVVVVDIHGLWRWHGTHGNDIWDATFAWVARQDGVTMQGRMGMHTVPNYGGSITAQVPGSCARRFLRWRRGWTTCSNIRLVANQAQTSVSRTFLFPVLCSSSSVIRTLTFSNSSTLLLTSPPTLST